VSEDETGLIYMRARHMDPALGRFISEDPARDGANWFLYCEGNPTSYTDRSGMVTEELALLELQVARAAAAVGMGQALIARLQVAVLTHGANILAAMRGGGGGWTVRPVRNGVTIFNEKGQNVFIHLRNLHKGMAPHFDVDPNGMWTSVWRELYKAINKLGF